MEGSSEQLENKKAEHKTADDSNNLLSLAASEAPPSTERNLPQKTAANDSEEKQQKISRIFDDTIVALGYPRFFTGPDDQERESATAVIKKALEIDPKIAKEELEKRKDSSTARWTNLTEDLGEAFNQARATNPGFVKVDENLAKEFAQAAKSNDAGTAGRLLEQVGPCGWDNLFRKSAEQVQKNGEDFRLSSHSTLSTAAEEFRIDKVSYLVGGFKGYSNPSLSEFASVAGNRCDAAVVPKMFSVGDDPAGQLKAAVQSSQGMDVARIMERISPQDLAPMIDSINKMDPKDSNGNQFRISSAVKRDVGGEHFSLLKTQYLNNIAGASEPSQRNLATINLDRSK